MNDTEALSAWLAAARAERPILARVPVEGAEIACRAWRTDEANLPGLILLHGFQAHAAWWDHLAPALAADGRRVVAFDFSGMGDSDRRTIYKRAIHARELIAVADAFGMERPAVIGHSYGAIVALAAFGLAPNGFERGILIEPWLNNIAGDPIEMPLGVKRVFPSLAAARARFRLLPPEAWAHKDVLDYIMDASFKETEEGWTWKFDPGAPVQLLDDEPYPPLAHVAIPVDYLYGEHTEVVRLENSLRAHEILPTSGRPIAIPAAHHHSMIEQPAALLCAMRALFANPRAPIPPSSK
ncbi:MAG: alpha/beta fold hydrolase [Hyphomonadaceae bacterium]